MVVVFAPRVPKDGILSYIIWQSISVWVYGISVDSSGFQVSTHGLHFSFELD